jgi:VanZ family protein
MNQAKREGPQGPRPRVPRAWLAAAGVYAVVLLSPAKLPLRYVHLLGRITLHETVHFALFALLAGTVPFAARRRGLRWAMAGALVGLAAGAELLQRVIPDRIFTMRDLAANVLGCLTGLAAGALLRWLLTRLRPV